MLLVKGMAAFSGRVGSNDWTEGGGYLAAKSDLRSRAFCFFDFFCLNLDAGYMGVFFSFFLFLT